MTKIHENTYSLTVTATRLQLDGLTEMIAENGPIDLTEASSQAIADRTGKPVEYRASLDLAERRRSSTKGQASNEEALRRTALETLTRKETTEEPAEECPFGIKLVEKAKELVLELAPIELPPDFKLDGPEFSGHVPYPKRIAKIRHEYTNYEELLSELPLCVDNWQDEEARLLCLSVTEDGKECPHDEEAHDLLKRAATDLARDIHQKYRH